jgi:hypothetical protein
MKCEIFLRKMRILQENARPLGKRRTSLTNPALIPRTKTPLHRDVVRSSNERIVHQTSRPFAELKSRSERELSV